jgi:hypothetical protein
VLLVEVLPSGVSDSERSAEQNVLALVKDFVGGEPSVGLAVRDFGWGSLRNSFSPAETED